MFSFTPVPGEFLIMRPSADETGRDNVAATQSTSGLPMATRPFPVLPHECHDQRLMDPIVMIKNGFFQHCSS